MKYMLTMMTLLALTSPALAYDARPDAAPSEATAAGPENGAVKVEKKAKRMASKKKARRSKKKKSQEEVNVNKEGLN